MGWPYQQKPPMGWEIDPDHPLSDFVAFLPMWEGSGNKVQDLSGNSYNGIATATPVWQAGKYGISTYYAGDSAYKFSLSRPPIGSGQSKLTVMACFSTAENQIGSTRYIIIYTGSGYDAFELKIDATEDIAFGVAALSDHATYVARATDAVLNKSGTWFSTAGVMDGSYVRLFVDGIETATPIAWPGGVIDTVTNFDLYIGEAFYGKISHVFVWHRALSSSEIALLYREPFCMFKDPAEIALLGGYQAVVAGMAGAMTTNTGYWGW